MILDAKARDKREKDFYETQKKREEARKLAMERAQKNKAAREARERAVREAREKAAKEQAAKTAKERDAEEKAYYESPVKDMHQAKKNDILQYTYTGTDGNKRLKEEKNNYRHDRKYDEYSENFYELSRNMANPVVKKYTEDNPYDPMAKYDDLFKDGLPNKVPSSPEEREENINYYFSKVLQSKIDEVKSSGSMAKKGVFGGGVSARGVIGGSGSVGLYEVHDNKGNKGLLITTGAGGGAGLSNAIVVDTIFSPEMDSIYDLEGASLTQGGSLNIGLLSAGYDNVKPITENGEDLPAVHSVAFGLNLPSPADIPLEYHAEGGKAWLIPLGSNNPDYIVRKKMIEDLEEQLERYNNE